jgi:two-component sensor histidine kinase
VDDTGRIVREVKVASEPEALLPVLGNPAYHFTRIGLEAGPLSQWLYSALAEAGLPAVAYDVSGTDWKLSITDNGIGKPDGVFAQPKGGLGTGIVNALAKQLNAQVETLSGSQGTTVSITHATFVAKGIRAA